MSRGCEVEPPATLPRRGTSPRSGAPSCSRPTACLVDTHSGRSGRRRSHLVVSPPPIGCPGAPATAAGPSSWQTGRPAARRAASAKSHRLLTRLHPSRHGTGWLVRLACPRRSCCPLLKARPARPPRTSPRRASRVIGAGFGSGLGCPHTAPSLVERLRKILLVATASAAAAHAAAAHATTASASASSSTASSAASSSSSASSASASASASSSSASASEVVVLVAS